ncbi:2-hydroxyacid dehydrogenase [Paracoccus tegillarcae]|uniref:Dihydrofolate reductase n=1 Tax=Paracoccus tegillarcae TaxID=1529068 RepID=A0A2K9EG53_9RHOB|nr:2-hydroxyacid dehydrogenase [Paracoccus tegillarcae]AUH33319.1 dihydrofolate reductase [Paracoccus tegillarcae]
MTKPDVMMLYPMRPVAMAQLEAAYTLHRVDLAEDKAAFIAENGPNCRAIVTNGHVPVTREIIEAMPRLELVACSSAGFESFDLAAMAEHGVKLTNTSSALSDDVADTAIMLMLAARRGLVPADAYVRSGDWAKKGMFPLQRSIAGKRLGIVGMGTIGQEIARRAEALKMQVSYWNRRAKDLPWDYQADLVTLARDSDVLIAIVAGGEGTRGLISDKVMAALGPDGLLINVSRGSVVDETALINALRSGALGHAALDVFASEPDADPALTALPNVTLYPHHASGTVETRDAMAQLVVDNLAALYAGQALLTPVDLRAYAPAPAQA